MNIQMFEKIFYFTLKRYVAVFEIITNFITSYNYF